MKSFQDIENWGNWKREGEKPHYRNSNIFESFTKLNNQLQIVQLVHVVYILECEIFDISVSVVIKIHMQGQNGNKKKWGRDTQCVGRLECLNQN